MQDTPTKILHTDLEKFVFDLVDDLKRVAIIGQPIDQPQGITQSLYKRLTEINTDLMDKNTKAVVSDLVNAFVLTKKPAIQRIKDLELMLQIALTDGKDGSEKFEYDPTYENIVKHTVKTPSGTVLFTIVYSYVDLATGVLKDSIKTFKDQDGGTVEVKKVYTYDATGKITDITTTTVITPLTPPPVSP